VTTKHIVPPIIENWIETIRNPNSPQHVKDNIIMMLESVVSACQEEIIKYRTARQNYLDKSYKRTKKKHN